LGNAWWALEPGSDALIAVSLTTLLLDSVMGALLQSHPLESRRS
jgi:hypothetical protein